MLYVGASALTTPWLTKEESPGSRPVGLAGAAMPPYTVCAIAVGLSAYAIALRKLTLLIGATESFGSSQTVLADSM